MKFTSVLGKARVHALYHGMILWYLVTPPLSALAFISTCGKFIVYNMYC